MLPIIMCRGPIDLSTRTPLSIARLSASAPSSHDLSLAAFTINIAESNFRHTQVADSQGTAYYYDMPILGGGHGEKTPRHSNGRRRRPRPQRGNQERKLS